MDLADDAEFLRAFEARSIPLDAWMHRSHVRMAYLYLRDHGLDEGLRRIRSGIQALNASHGDKVPEGRLDRGYHETLTVAWARIIHGTIRAWGGEADFAAFAAAHPHLLQRTLTRLFYSRARMMTWEAKRGFVEPDLTPLP
jgi:hypothetical protein